MHWHHFSFMVISLALLGYGMSGSFISLFRDRFSARFNRVFALNALLFGLSALLCFSLVRQLSFNELEILWDPGQWLRLVLVYLLLCLPFFFVANAIALSFVRFPHDIARIYGIDLLAAGGGALSIILLLGFLRPETALRVIAIAGVSSVLFYRPLRSRGLVWATAPGLITLLVVIPDAWIEPTITPYKGLPQALQIKDARHLDQFDSARSRIDVVASDSVPFRHAPGLSLLSPAGPPPQLAIFVDGDEMHVMDQTAPRSELAYHAWMTSALPYLLHEHAADALLLNAGSGQALQQARWFGIDHIVAVEPERRLADLPRTLYTDYTGEQTTTRPLRVHPVTARAFIARGQRFDLVLMGPPGASSGASAGVASLAESYDLTVEAISAYLASLQPGGLLAITLWIDNPPRSNPRLFATAVEALRGAGVAQPGNHLAWIRSWNTATLVISSLPLEARQRAGVRDFCNSRGFDLAWLPDIEPQEVNRFQILAQPLFYLAARALLAENPGSFVDDYRFDIAAVSDDRPFFNLFLPNAGLSDALSLPPQTAAALTGLGYPALLITLLQAVLAALLLILLPLAFLRQSPATRAISRSAIVLFFVAVGLAYLFIEIAFIQRFTLLLDHPLYALATVLGSFLVFSGLGSLFVQRQLETARANPGPLLRIAVPSIMLFTAISVFVLPLLTDTLLGLANWVKLLLGIAMIAPLAFFMGMPLTLGLTQLQNNAPAYIAWAWGINGCASVLSAILAVLLAVHFGFSIVLLCAAGLYLVALLAAQRFAHN